MRWFHYYKILLLPALIAISGLCFVFFLSEDPAPDPALELPPIPEDVQQLKIVPVDEAYPYVLEPNTTLFQALRDLEVTPTTIHDLVQATKPVQNLAQLKAGTRFQIKKDNGNDLSMIEFYFSPVQKLKIEKTMEKWIPTEIKESVDIEVTAFSGEVITTLWESAIHAKMDPQLIVELAEIFGGEVDFNREVRAKDRWRLIVEKKSVKGEPVGWGAILTAEYINDGKSHQATLFRWQQKDLGYFNLDGTSLRKMFLKSPIRYGRVTSSFKRKRFHPILQVYRPHLGVDYGAPVGTPVRTVADGTVIWAQRSGGGGNVVKIRHNSTYQTAYKHLSGYARRIRSGVHVQQGEVIGYVGNTGLSTGPHLHFEFYRNGQYVDPLRQKFPSTEPVPKDLREAFLKQSREFQQLLPAWSNSAASVGRPTNTPSSTSLTLPSPSASIPVTSLTPSPQ